MRRGTTCRVAVWGVVGILTCGAILFLSFPHETRRREVTERLRIGNTLNSLYVGCLLYERTQVYTLMIQEVQSMRCIIYMRYILTQKST